MCEDLGKSDVHMPLLKELLEDGTRLHTEPWSNRVTGQRKPGGDPMCTMYRECGEQDVCAADLTRNSSGMHGSDGGGW